ncbi:hypothetical protein LX36DRAFT_752617 [Colletotrichum falcatum]|nr:hypothetical protein LX36DRAFT_752617 [Colletotrichum falcatum]
MADQYRIKALQEGTGYLPYELNVQLRANRRDPSLPDNHGQTWLQLVSIASMGPGTFEEGRVCVDYKLVEALRLGVERNFPTRRLEGVDDYFLL